MKRASVFNTRIKKVEIVKRYAFTKFLVPSSITTTITLLHRPIIFPSHPFSILTTTQMPLKKKQRGSSVLEASTPIAQTPGETHHNDNATPKLAELDSELWTNEEEISLFKGMIRWKPVGVFSFSLSPFQRRARPAQKKLYGC